jgi:DnaJ-class molecular chaperone
MNFKERKTYRKDYYYKYIFCWRLRKCRACNGSGYYDDNGSPKCTVCNGSGKERYFHKKDN